VRQQAKQAASAPVPLLPEHRHSPLHGLVVLTARASALFPGKKKKETGFYTVCFSFENFLFLEI